ncbi:hypothetical protein [Corynebacterium ulcerans]|uniref:hypothetical protein n=1 Tax=Corynebacterium ulcerans TaxID=65058 RepID=UPI001E3603B2|nr:hypothetical protein [Corynebacterium ulcerans]
MLEKMIEKHLTQTAKKYGGTTLKNNDPNKAGMPDRLILLPRGKHAFAEIKAPGKKTPPTPGTPNPKTQKPRTQGLHHRHQTKSRTSHP